MLPSDMNLKISSGTVGYNNKILISDGKFSLWKNGKANTPAMKSHKYSKTNSLEPTAQGLAQKPNISHKKQEPQTITHNEEKIAFGTFSGKWFCNLEYV